MGIRNSIRNFFYAATHANQLIAENEQLRTDSQTLNGRLWKAEDTQRETAEVLEAVKRQRDNLSVAMKMLAPKDISLATLQNLYCAVSHSSLAYEKAGEQLLWRSWHARQYIQETPIWEKAETEIYRTALAHMGILPENSVDVSPELQNSIIESIGTKFDPERLSSRIPIGKIDFLYSRESIEYRNAGEFVSQIMDSNWNGEPMSITVYSDPKTGAHINTSWILDMDPPPQSFQVKPYDPVANLTAHFTRAQLVEEVDKRIIRRVAIESTDDYTEPGFGQDTVDIDVQNEDGSYGRVVDKYRIVTINNEGDRLVSMTRPYDSYEAAMATVQGNPSIKVVSYDELVHEVGARKGIKNPTYDLNQYSTEQIQQAIDQLDNCPAIESPAPSPVPEFELEI